MPRPWIRTKDKPKETKALFVGCEQCGSCPYKKNGTVNPKCDHYFRGLCTVESVNRAGPFTLEAIGDGFGITRERIRQIEAKALKKLRKWMGTDVSKELRDYLVELGIKSRKEGTPATPTQPLP